METKTKLTSLLRLSTITSLAMLFMGSVSFAEDATTSSEYTPSYELEKVDATPATNDFTVTKYEQDSTGAYVEVQYKLTVNELGDAEGTAKYFNWSADEDGNLSLKEDTSADVSSGDVVVGVDDGTERIEFVSNYTTTVSGDIEADFAGFVDSTKTGSDYGGAIYYSYVNQDAADASESYSITGDFVANGIDTTISASSISSYGGAIYVEYSTLNELNGNFVGNSVKSTVSNYAYDVVQGFGGALAVYRSEIVAIEGDFIGNSVESSSDTAGSSELVAIGGAIYNDDNSEIENIEGDFIGNYVSVSSVSTDTAYVAAFGGAIYNDGTIGDIASDFISNYAISTHIAQGGAISNIGNIDLVEGDFMANYAMSESSDAVGGAILNVGTITEIAGDFIGNSASTESASAQGGAIYNPWGTITTIDGDFIENYVKSTLNAQGGAIFNWESSKIDDIAGDFIGNSATSTSSYAQGGAIFNYAGTKDSYSTISSIAGDFIANSAISTSSDASGGAIYNYGAYSNITTYANISSIEGNIANNYAIGGTNAFGGAIYNYYGTIDIEGNITGNYAQANTKNALGGAIYNIGGNISIEGDITDNYVQGETNAFGGAIYNSTAYADFSIIGNIANNYAKGGTYAYGGAIYNSSGNISIEGDITDNYASGETALGGVVYNYNGSVTFSATDGENYSYTGNFATTSTANADGSYTLSTTDDANGGFLYMNSSSSLAYAKAIFDIDNNSSITIGYTSDDANYKEGYDSIASDDANSLITKTGEGTLTVNSSMASYTGTLTIEEGLMEYTNSAILGASVKIGATTYTDGTTAEFAISADSLSTSKTTTVYANGTLSLIGGELSSDEASMITLNSGANLNFYNEITVDNYTIADGASLNVYGTVNGDVAIANGTLNVIINEANAESEGIVSISDTGSVNVYINDIASLLGSTTSVLGNEYSEDISLVMDSNLDKGSYTLITGTYDITIGNSVKIEQGEASATYSISEEAGSSDVNISVEGDYSLTDTTSTSTLNIANATTGSTTEASASVDVGTLSVDSKVETAIVVENVDLKDAEVSMDSEGDVVAVSAKTDTTISGTVSVNADNASSAVAVEVANESGNITLDDGSSISSTASGESSVAITNTHAGDVESNGLNIKLKGSASVSGSIIANSPLTITGTGITDNSDLINGDSTFEESTLTVKGDITTANSDVDSTESEDITIEDAILVVDGSDFENGVSINTGAGKIILTAAGLSVTKATITTASIEIDTDSYATIANSTITGATSSAIYNNGGTLTVSDSTFENNTSSDAGAAILNFATSDDSTIVSISGEFTSNEVSATESSAFGGAIYNTTGQDGNISTPLTSSIGSISADFTGNSATSDTGTVYGGAIANDGGTSSCSATIGDITGAFLNNYVESTSSSAYGGAISNYKNIGTTASIGAIAGSFTGNYAISVESSAAGGAIYNDAASITSIEADFTDNYATSTESAAYGGAIYNSTIDSTTSTIGYIIGDFTNNSATSTNNSTYGGAIYNTGTISDATIGIDGNFTGNTASGTVSTPTVELNYSNDPYNKVESTVFVYGGAIYNSGTITDIKGDFTDNSALAYATIESDYEADLGDYTDLNTDFSSTASAYGGAIYNSSTMGDITGSFIGNSVFADASMDATTGESYSTFITTFARGGAIYNISSIDDIEGSFTDNSATSTSGDASGGAIYNAAFGFGSSTIESIDGKFTSNYVSASGEASGGAISNYATGSATSTITSITGDFEYNTATSTSGDAYGGAIYNSNYYFWGYFSGTAIIESIAGNFTGNSAISISAFALGGAIYNQSTISSLEGDFTDNNVYAYDWAAGGAVYNYYGTVSIKDSIFTNNYAISDSSSAEGGAIYNDYLGTANITDSSFVNNYVSGAESYGGAIYSYAGTINFSVTTGESYNYGNWAGVDESSADDANGGFLYMYSGTAKFDIGSDASLTIGDGTAGYDSIASNDSNAVINKTGAGTLTVNSSMEYFTGTVNVTEGTFNLANVLGGDLVIGTDSTADFNIYITENNTVATDSTLSVGTVAADSTAIVKSISATDAESVDVYIEDIALVLGTTTTLTNSTTNITWNLDNASNYGDTVSLADNILTIASSVVLDTASGATVSNKTGSVVLTTTSEYTMTGTTLTVDSVSGNVTVSTDATLTLDTESIDATSTTVTLNGGTIATTTSLTLDTAATTGLVITSGTLAATAEGSSIDLANGDTELAGDLTLSGNIVLGDSTDSYTKEESTFSGSYTLGLDDATIYIYDDSDLTLNTSTVSGSTLLIQGEEGSDVAVNLGAITVSDSDVTTAVSTNSNVSGATITFNTTEDVTGIEVSSSDVELTGSITVSNNGAGEVIAVEVSDDSGIVTLGNGVTIASDNTAITNTHEEDEESNGLNLVLNGATASVVGDIVANSPLSISVAQEEITNGTWTGSTLDVTGNIITNNDDVNDLENNDITITDVDVTVSGYVTTGGGDISIRDGSLNATGVINLSDGEETTGSISLVGSDLTIGTDSTIDSITMTTGTDGTMSTVSGAGVSSLADDSITIVVSAAMLKDSTFTISKDANLTNALADVVDADFSLDTSAGTEITITELTYFQNKEESYTANEYALAYALDNISADGESVGDTDYDAKVALKLAADSADLSSYVMSNYSQIAEVNTMLLGNQNFANVNRARSILEKSAGIQIEDEDGSISIENEDGTISVVDASEVSLIKYSNVAQLQSINMLGSKDASNGVAGYDYWSVGSTANFDEILSENALIGASIGGTYNKVTGDAGESANSTTFLLNAYAVYANEDLEVFGNIGYAHFWNEGYNAGSKADWDSDAFNALIGISYDLETSIDGLIITPLAMLNMVLQDIESASYSNGVDLNSESYFSAKLMLGFEFEYAISSQFNAIIRTMYMHEMGDDSYDFTYGVGSYLAGINYQGSSAGKDSALIGLGLSYDFSETCTAYFDYNAYVYESLITHSLNLSVALKF